MRRRFWMGTLAACAVVALTAVAATAGNPPMRLYVGQTNYQRSQQKMHEQDSKRGGRKYPGSMFQSWMKVSTRGIEGFSLSGPCGSTIWSYVGPRDPAVPVRNGGFKYSRFGTVIAGRLTATTITGTYSPDGTKRCTTGFTLRAQSR
jgi:hypothetical protein